MNLFDGKGAPRGSAAQHSDHGSSVARRLTIILICCLATILVTPATAVGSTNSLADVQAWMTNGSVVASAIGADGTTYIGGSFTYVGPCTGDGAALDATSGAADLTFPTVTGIVNVTIADGTGGYYIGGSFYQVGDSARHSIAHLLADGSIDPSFDPDANGSVWALALSGSTIYVGGEFTTIGGQTRNRIAALDTGSGLATAWNPNASNVSYPQVSALAVSGSTIYVGGNFDAIGGQTRNRIAALDEVTDLATSWNPEANGSVKTLVVSGSLIYAGGSFTAIGGQTRDRVAALDATTGSATAWDPDADGSVLSLAVSGSTVYAGGSFRWVDGQNRNRIAAIDTASGAVSDWNPDASDTVYSVAVSGSTVYAGGAFTTIAGQARSCAAALDAASGLATAWDPSASVWLGSYSGPQVHALAISGSTVYAGGYFESIGGVARSRIAALDAVTGSATDWDPGANGSVDVLAVSGSTVYAGGDFTTIGGQARNCIAALDATSGDATSWDPSAAKPGYTHNVTALALSGGIVYAGGDFTSIGGQTRSSIAALDAVTGLATAWDPNAIDTSSPQVRALVVSGPIVYVGGAFIGIGGQARDNIAALDTTTGAATSWNPDAGDTVYALAASGSTVYAGGGFATIGGQSRYYIAALNTTTGAVTSWDPDVKGYGAVYAIAATDTLVYVGGTFNGLGGKSRRGVGAVGAASGLATSWNPGWDTSYSDRVQTLAVSDAGVYVGGTFKSMAGQARSGLARFSFGPDISAPTTTASGADDGWHKTAVIVTLTAVEDPDGSGLQSITYSVDGGAPVVVNAASTQVTIPAPADHSNDGRHVITFSSVDNALNTETPGSVVVGIDTTGPVCLAPSTASVVQTSPATLKYRVNDPLSVFAVVTLKVKTAAGRTVRTMDLGLQPTNRIQTKSVTFSFTPGKYRFYIYATDLAGNEQTKVGVNTLIIKARVLSSISAGVTYYPNTVVARCRAKDQAGRLLPGVRVTFVWRIGPRVTFAGILVPYSSRTVTTNAQGLATCVQLPGMVRMATGRRYTIAITARYKGVVKTTKTSFVHK